MFLITFLITLLQDVYIDKKLKEAPDASYAIGVFIGTILPFFDFGVYRIYNLQK
ncbi:hypothetical protein [Winogradskyella sp.]|uniref:hypothetical protein n=1 Tax=Winogradskyella sp. TaxID=1883156 RepID=UPI0025DE4750|nr:hypothetical protein [Winogradskyella sp.]